jgi:hypothetical protein
MKRREIKRLDAINLCTSERSNANFSAPQTVFMKNVLMEMPSLNAGRQRHLAWPAASDKQAKPLTASD